MRLLLIDPVTTARTLSVESRRKLRQGIGYPGLGLFTVAALTSRDIEVKVIDESVEAIDENFQPDLVGISVQAPTAPYAYRLAQRYQQRGVTVVLGGIHVSLNPEEAATHADAIVVGEAELTWPQLVSDFRRGELRREYRAERLADLDASPIPRRDLMRPDDYQIPYVVQASKGCPFGCEFCSLHAYVGAQPRFRRVDRVVEEIESLDTGVVLFADDNIYSKKRYAEQLFRALAPLKKRWVAEATWHIAFDDEVLALARQSGCEGLFIGFDSVNRPAYVPKAPSRGSVEEIYVEATRRIVDRGMAVVAAFVFGFDEDDTSVFRRAVEIVNKGGASLVNFSALVPYPGTPVYELFKAEGRITETDWAKYISPNVCFEPRGMTAAELYEGTLWAQQQAFSLANITKRGLLTASRLGWGTGLLALKLNLAQRSNWGEGSPSGEAA